MRNAIKALREFIKGLREGVIVMLGHALGVALVIWVGSLLPPNWQKHEPTKIMIAFQHEAV